MVGKEAYINEYATIYIEDDIVFGVFKANLFVDLEAAKRIVEDRKKISDYKNSLIFVDVSSVKGVSKEARDYFGSFKGTEFVKASAIFTNSKLSVFLANFLIKVNLSGYNIPVRLFTDKNQAVKWLKSFQ